jgi:2,3-bisphosphoglycerate-independent phosphoglycerate mutase
MNSVVLINISGLGVAQPSPGNAVSLASTKNLDKYWPKYPHGYLECSGEFIGLREFEAGDVRLGNLTMGTGRIVQQGFNRISNSIQNESFFENPVLIKSFENAKENEGAVHLIGELSNHQINSSIEHLFALIELAKERGFDPDKLYIHLVIGAEGRMENDAEGVLQKIEDFCIEKRMGRVASLIGNNLAKDKKELEKYFKDLTQNKDVKAIHDWRRTIRNLKKKKVSDADLPNTFFTIGGDPAATIRKGDSVIVFNFKNQNISSFIQMLDEAVELKKPDFSLTLLTELEEAENANKAYPTEEIIDSLAETISQHGLNQIKISDYESFDAATYWFNGKHKETFQGEQWVKLPKFKGDPKENPEMNIDWITQLFLENFERQKADFYYLHYSTLDMIAETQSIELTVQAIEAFDAAFGRIIQKVLEQNSTIILTSDHAKVEEMIDLKTGQIDIKNTKNQVPVLIISLDLSFTELPVRDLSDVAPTVLKLLDIVPPVEINGTSLI